MLKKTKKKNKNGEKNEAELKNILEIDNDIIIYRLLNPEWDKESSIKLIKTKKKNKFKNE